MSKEFYFIKQWKRETLEKIKLVYPNIDEDYLNKYLDNIISNRFKDSKCSIINTHKNKSANTSLLQMIQFIHDKNPIISGYGVLFNNQNISYSPAAKMLMTLKADRDKLKKERKKYDERSYEFLMKDIGQDNKKRLMNSFYGASGARTSTFYNLETAASVTGTGQALIALAETSYEQLLADNTKFFNMDEFLLFVNRNLYKTTYKNFDKIVPNIDNIKELTKDKIIKSFMYKEKIDYDIIIKVLDNLSNKELHILYFKNNINEFFTKIPDVRKIISKVLNRTKKFRDPNNVPNEIKSELNTLWDYCYEIVCSDFPIRDRIIRDKYHKRKVCITQDTDSTMLTINNLVDLFIMEFLDEEIEAETDDDILFIIVNTIAFFLAKWSKVFLNRYGEDSNIPEEYRIFNIKNEFFYPLMVLTSTKKRYITLMKLQEGKVVEPMKIDVHGLDFAKAETSDKTKAFFDGIIEREIMYADEINVPKIFREIKNFEHTIRESLLKGELDYLPIKSVKEVNAYEDPLSEAGLKAVRNWNIAYPDMEINLPDKVLVVKINAIKRKDFDVICKYIPENIREKYIKQIFENNNEKVVKNGLSVIALPQNIGSIPDWIVKIADIQTIIDDNVSKFNPILISLGNVPVRTRSNITHIGNIINI